MPRISSWGGRTPNSRDQGNPKPLKIQVSRRVKLILGFSAIAIGLVGITWIVKETIEGERQNASILSECKQYYAKLNAQMESRGLPPLATGEVLEEYCEEWVANPPGFDK